MTSYASHPIRLALAIGDAAREAALAGPLQATGEYAISAISLNAQALVEALDAGRAQAALVGERLLGLDDAVLRAAAARSTSLVLLSGHPERWSVPGIQVLPALTDAEAIRDALSRARPSLEPIAEQAEEQRSDREAPSDSTVLVWTSGHGSPGRTTGAVALAGALGYIAPTALVDLDMQAPSVLACLGGGGAFERRRNAHYLLTNRRPRNPQEWREALDQEVQRMGWYAPYGGVLLGLPDPTRRDGLSGPMVSELIANLRDRFRYVVLDIGGDFLGVPAHRTAVAEADQVLLVAEPSFVGLVRARTALVLLAEEFGVPRREIALVLNGYHRRTDAPLREIEEALGHVPSAVVPYDRRGARAAQDGAVPLGAVERSAAGREFRALAAKVDALTLAAPQGSSPRAARRTGFSLRARA